MNKETIKYVLRQFVERQLPRFERRSLEVPADSGKVVCLIGARRTGKTFMMLQIMSDLLEAEVDRERIVYLNLEDDRLYPVDAQDLDLVLKAHRELFPGKPHEKRYLFFDEIQNVSGWERYVRRIYDTENVAIFLTGSSSALLQKDMSSAMRGRSITYEIFPLSFSEFLSSISQPGMQTLSTSGSFSIAQTLSRVARAVTAWVALRRGVGTSSSLFSSKVYFEQILTDIFASVVPVPAARGVQIDFN